MHKKALDAAHQPDYVSYLLRLWRVQVGGEQTWRASLEDPHTGERLGFAGFEELFSFLQEQNGRSSDGHRSENRKGSV
jgi:hypothetical protein